MLSFSQAWPMHQLELPSEVSMKSLAAALLLCLPLVGGLYAQETAQAVQPVSNPVYAETAIPQSRISLIYAWHALPNKVRTEVGKLKLGGDVNLIALQIEYALNEDLSLVANKDGYVWLDPDNTLSSESGFGDLSAGVKYRVWHEGSKHLALRGTIEVPTGSEKVLQGNGSGNFSPAVIMTHATETVSCNGVAGLIIPFDNDEESLTSYLSLGYSYRVTPKIAPLIELNWFHVLDAGGGQANFDHQGGNAVSSLVQFEGGDYFNLGAANADKHRDLVTVAAGASCSLTDNIDLAIAYEIPLTDEEASLFARRLNVNCTVRF
jgi:opacity protein-like surface antigen